MAGSDAVVEKSVTIDPELLERLGPERRQNFSATVNEGLRLLVALDAQQTLVEEWEAESGPFDEEELRPFLENALRAQLQNTMRSLSGRGAAST